MQSASVMCAESISSRPLPGQNFAVKTTIVRVIASVLAVSVADPAAVLGQAGQPPAAAIPPAAAPQAPGQPTFSAEEIDQMTAPIALYPDQLLSQILVASTYPLEIVQAERWVSDPANAALEGDQLAAALQSQTWDPSVKTLAPYPQVLKMMSEQLSWTQRLGDAVLAQQADVMASVQRLRKRAEGAGSLQTNEQQTVINQGGDTIVIQPTNPQTVYVPAYNPTVVYGTWPYPAYPPPYYPPPPAYYPGYALGTGLMFGLGVASIAALTDCCNSDWNGGSININSERYNNINRENIRNNRATQLPADQRNWQHDPGHRGGVAYRDPGSRQNFQQRPRVTPTASRESRGYAGGQSGGQLGNGGAQRGQVANRGQGISGSGQRPGGGDAQRGQVSNRGQGLSGSGQRQAGSGSRQPSAFGGMGNGGQVRAQADRGRASQRSFQSNGGGRAGGGARAGGGGGRGGRR